jgi:NAD(P)-dependent dehydrogenase (short-subunit alcohol dehydrogenase family)
MLRNKTGSIINFSSASSNPPLSRAFAYSAAKAGIMNLTKNLARDWAPSGIRVNALRPGFFPTEWNKKNFIDKERESAILSHTPMGRFGEPAELVSGAIWLASNSSSFVTGTELIIDGGFLCKTI